MVFVVVGWHSRQSQSWPPLGVTSLGQHDLVGSSKEASSCNSSHRLARAVVFPPCSIAIVGCWVVWTISKSSDDQEQYLFVAFVAPLDEFGNRSRISSGRVRTWKHRGRPSRSCGEPSIGLGRISGSQYPGHRFVRQSRDRLLSLEIFSMPPLTAIQLSSDGNWTSLQSHLHRELGHKVATQRSSRYLRPFHHSA